jgi:transcriptional regulator with XRE-family HTH domain
MRHARNLTIEALAFAANMHPTYLSGIERGRRNPTWGKLCDLSSALDVPVSQLALEVEELHGHLARAQAAGLDAETLAVLGGSSRRVT